MIKIIILSNFCQFDLEMTLRLHGHDLEVIPSLGAIPDHVIICD